MIWHTQPDFDSHYAQGSRTHFPLQRCKILTNIIRAENGCSVEYEGAFSIKPVENLLDFPADKRDWCSLVVVEVANVDFLRHNIRENLSSKLDG